MRTGRRFLLLMALLVTVSSTAGVVWFIGGRNEAQTYWKPGGPVPDFEVQTFSGKKFSRENLRGKRYGLVFFSPRCRHCGKELQQMNRFAARDVTGSPLVLAISLGEFWETRAFLWNYAPGMEYALDEDHLLKQSFKVHQVPTLFFINEEAKLLHCRVGGNGGKSLQALLDLLVSEGNSMRQGERAHTAEPPAEEKLGDPCDACEKP